MGAGSTGALVFAGLVGAALLGMLLHAALPDHHLSPDTKDTVRVGMGSVATMAALVLGLLVSSTKQAYDAERSEVIAMAAKIMYLDRVLLDFGPETAETRDLLRRALEHSVARMWPGEESRSVRVLPGNAWTEALPNAIQKLAPQNDLQRALKAQAAQITSDLGQLRWLLFEQSETSISPPLLAIVITWLAIMFVSLGLFAPPNATAVTALVLSALSVSGAIFLILELDLPFDGLMRISSEPMRNAVAHLAR